jgi:hypothetical protein
VKVANLAQLTRVHRNTLRNPSSERLQGRMREMVKVISAATELTGDIDKAIYWYRNEPIADYGHAGRGAPNGSVWRQRRPWAPAGTTRNRCDYRSNSYRMYGLYRLGPDVSDVFVARATMDQAFCVRGRLIFG